MCMLACPSHTGSHPHPLTLSLCLIGMGKKDDPSLMHQWFKLVQEKNALVRYESELMILWVFYST